MVIMKNIRIQDNYILVDCYKEGMEEGYFSLILSAQTGEIIETSLDKPSIYSRQAALKVKELFQKGQMLPKEIKAVWC